jgi:aminopeptidase N
MLMPYPYPHMTAVEGIIGGGMEYPMMTLIGSNYRPRGLFSVTYHEISHMWFPMIVGQNEKHYTWMDEGTTSFNTAEGASDFYNDDAWESSNQSYFRLAGTDDEMPSMRHADNYPFGTPARGIASYSKPALILHALRGIIGEERFFEAYRTYAERWAYKHPQPYDLFNTFEDVLSQDLDWFWTPTLYETWTLDHAVARVDSSVDSPRVTIADEGLVPMPVPLRVTYADGTTINRMVPVDVWLKGTRETTVNLEPGSVTGVVIDPKWYLPDVDRSDNRWSSGSRSASDGG